MRKAMVLIFILSPLLFVMSCERAIEKKKLELIQEQKEDTSPKATSTNPMADCVLLVQLNTPGNQNPLDLCFYKRVETRGIFSSKACVGVYIETTSLNRQPFYGTQGHWGIEGDCNLPNLILLLNNPKTYTTLNPITKLSNKKKNGWTFNTLQDTFNLVPIVFKKLGI